MIDKHRLQLFKELFDRSSSVLIMCPNDALRDQILAAASLYATLKTNFQKNIKFFIPQSSQKEDSSIAYLQEAQTEIGHENLCISLDYIDNSINEITSHVSNETNKLYLTIKPKKGFLPPSEESVRFSYTGADADMIILVGVDDLNSLGRLYLGYEKLFNSTALVSINSYETEFGNFKFDIIGTSSFCEFVAQVLVDLNIPIDNDSATNLLAGINEETGGFISHMTTADTFEMIAKLIRAGARRYSREIDSEPNKVAFVNQENSEFSQKLQSFGKESEAQDESLDNDELQINDESSVSQSHEPPEDNEPLVSQPTVSSPRASYTSSKINKKLNKNNFRKTARERARESVRNPAKKSLGNRNLKQNNNNNGQNQKKAQPGDLNYQPTGFGPAGE